MQRTQIEAKLLEGCRRLAGKGFLKTPAGSFSMRVPGSTEMIFASGCADWREIGVADLQTAPFSIGEGGSGLHAPILHAADCMRRSIESGPTLAQ